MKKRPYILLVGGPSWIDWYRFYNIWSGGFGVEKTTDKQTDRQTDIQTYKRRIHFLIPVPAGMAQQLALSWPPLAGHFSRPPKLAPLAGPP